MNVPKTGKNPSVGIHSSLPVLCRSAFVHGFLSATSLASQFSYSPQAALVWLFILDKLIWFSVGNQLPPVYSRDSLQPHYLWMGPQQMLSYYLLKAIFERCASLYASCLRWTGQAWFPHGFPVMEGRNMADLNPDLISSLKNIIYYYLKLCMQHPMIQQRSHFT